MAKDILNHSEIQAKILTGVNLLADSVKTTIGPKGRNSLIEAAQSAPYITNDGATITKEIDLQDPAVNTGAKLIREVAARTNDLAGDGTTTATVLAQAIISEGYKNIAAGANPVEIRKGIQGAAQLASAMIRKLAKPVETTEAIAQTAAISAEDAQIGEMVAEALDKVGPEGVVTIEESPGLTTTLEITEGMQFERGYLSPEFITDKSRLVAELKNPYILLTDRKLTTSQELLPVLEQVVPTGKPLLIIAEEVSGSALGTLVVNKQKGILYSAAVQPPAYAEGRRDRMQDLALFTGGQFVTEDLGLQLKDVTLDMLGTAELVTIEKHSTVILGGGGDPTEIAGKKESLRTLIRKTDYEFNKKRFMERLAKFSGGIAVIKAGAATEVEMKELKLRIDDALNAARAAMEEGIVPGGGVTYLHIAPALRSYADSLEGDRAIGARIMCKALEAPARQIAENAGQEGSAVLALLKQHPARTGYDVNTNSYVNMFEAGIIDSVKAVRGALENAASLCAVLLTTDAGVIST